MKILFASYNFGNKVVGGAQQSIKVVADELVARKQTVGVVYVNDPSKHWVDDAGIHRLEIPPNNLYWHPERRPSALNRAIWHSIDRFGGFSTKDVKAAISAFSPDIVHTNVLCGLTVDIWKASKELGVPVVHTVHDYYLLCINSGMRNKDGNCKFPCTSCKISSCRSRAFAEKYVSGVAYVSDHMRSKHEESNVFSKSAVRRKIVGAFRAAPAIISETLVAERANITFGFLGRIAPDKGIELLITAFKAASIPNSRLLVGGLGDSEFLDRMKALAYGTDVVFLGRVKPDSFFSSIDVLVVPSTWNEPAARVVYEAGVSHVPVAVSLRGGLPELVRNGDRGWTFDPDSQDDLKKLLLHISLSPDELYRKASAWDGAEAEFSPESICDETLDFYSEVLAKR